MRFLRPRDVLALIGVSRTTLWRMIRAGQFPSPVRITERRSGFLQETVESWMRSRVEGTTWESRAAQALPPRTGDLAVSPRLVAAQTPRRARA
jgi:prophage regulatory protein